MDAEEKRSVSRVTTHKSKVNSNNSKNKKIKENGIAEE
jgi:hypothetical protein